MIAGLCLYCSVTEVALRQCFLKQLFAEITISALLWGGKAAP